MKIWKHPINLNLENGQYVGRVNHSADGYLVSVQNQNDVLTGWVMTDEKAAQNMATKIVAVGTGETAPDYEQACFLNTVQFDNGRLVLHIFLVDVESSDEVVLDKDNLDERLESIPR